MYSWRSFILSLLKNLQKTVSCTPVPYFLVFSLFISYQNACYQKKIQSVFSPIFNSVHSYLSFFSQHLHPCSRILFIVVSVSALQSNSWFIYHFFTFQLSRSHPLCSQYVSLPLLLSLNLCTLRAISFFHMLYFLKTLHFPCTIFHSPHFCISHFSFPL